MLKITDNGIEYEIECDSDGVQAFKCERVPMQSRCRWFIKRGVTTKFNRGFRSKIEASNWINNLGSALMWRVGFTFRLRGDDVDMYIVNRRGLLATTRMQ